VWNRAVRATRQQLRRSPIAKGEKLWRANFAAFLNHATDHNSSIDEACLPDSAWIASLAPAKDTANTLTLKALQLTA
jgi:hypothetical protein